MSQIFSRTTAPPGSAPTAEPSTSFLPFGPPDLEHSLVRRFEQQAAHHPGRLAARVGDASIAYAELERAANRVAHAVLDAADGDEPVALLFGAGLDQIVAHLAVLKAGKACVPLDPTQPEPRLARVLAESGARILLTDGPRLGRATDLADASLTGHAPHRRARTAVRDMAALPLGLADTPPRVAITPATLAYVFYTAGSTGEPKGVMQSHRNLLRGARIYHHETRLRPEDRILCPMPLTYAGGVWGLHGALANGASLHRLPGDSAGGLTSLIARSEITVVQALTSLLRQLLRETMPGDRFPSLRLVYTGGEVLHSADVERFHEVFPGVELFYDFGSTEAGLVSHLKIDPSAGPDHYVHRRDGKTLIPVGPPLDGVEVLLLGADGRAVAPGAAGQIAVRSDFLSPGYWRDPERTAAVFRPDPAGGGGRIYLTGDIGARLPDGRLLQFGRDDLQAKIRGSRVGAGEIEAALRAEPAVSDAAVVAREDALGDARLVAYVACAPGTAPTVTTLRRRLAAVLPAPMIPSAFVFLDALPLSAIGKVDRASLPEPGRERPLLDVPYTPPRTRLEEMLTEAWAETLDLDQVGVDDNFVELGGHSLAAARLVFRLNEQFGTDLSLSRFLEAPTVATQARAIAQLMAARLSDQDLERVLDEFEAR